MSAYLVPNSSGHQITYANFTGTSGRTSTMRILSAEDFQWTSNQFHPKYFSCWTFIIL